MQMPLNGMRGVPALASAFASPSGSSWWLRASVRALASCHVVLAPPLSFFLRSSETEQPGSRQLLGTCRHSSFLPVPLASHSPPGFGCVPSGRCMTPPWPFFCISEAGPVSLPGRIPSLPGGLEVSVGCSPAFLLTLALPYWQNPGQKGSAGAALSLGIETGDHSLSGPSQW